jgi:hypothetical protein
VLERLTKTTLTGIANVVAVSGIAWPDLVANWWAATYLDQPTPVPGPLQYPDFDLVGFLAPQSPLAPTAIGPAGASSSASLWSSSVAYYLVSPGNGISLAIRLGGGAGGASQVQAAMRLRIVRVS